jgi:hypothetical protein
MTSGTGRSYAVFKANALTEGTLRGIAINVRMLVRTVVIPGRILPDDRRRVRGVVIMTAFTTANCSRR